MADERRKRVLDAVNHRQPDRIPLDFGSAQCTGIHCSVVEQLRDYYGLEKRPVKAFDPFQMLGWIEEDLMDAMDIDTAMVMPVSSIFGNRLDEWKEWQTHWGQKILIPKTMELDQVEDGGYVAYPQGDRAVPPSAKMPSNGYFFDVIERQQPYDEDNPDPKDNAADFSELSDETVKKIAENAKAARATGRAVMFTLPGGSLSSPSGFYGIGHKKPLGMRRLADWYMAFVAYPEFVQSVFDIQSIIAVKNLEKVYKVAGGDIDLIMLCTGDYGTQLNTFFSVDTYKEVFYPYHNRMCDWIHNNTPWKVFKHCCGSIEPLIGPMADAGIDILNPVQCSAANMDPAHLKKTYGSRLAFWGGGVDTQKTLPFGTPEEVRQEVLERCRIFSPAGGFVFNTIHNAQAKTPLENFIAMVNAVKEFNSRAGA
ncbi:MAG: methyltransferase [Treponema sp.]|nr:methyltransferase [Treponema sp.]